MFSFIQNVPTLISEPINLVRDVRIVVGDHKNDDHNLAVTGTPLLYWPGIQVRPDTRILNVIRELETWQTKKKLRI